MSNIQNIDISLHEIVKKISKDSYLIPKFQRDFTWVAKDILDLGDSIIRGYPISSLLIMAENGTLNVGSHSLSNEEFLDKSHSEEGDTKFYVLDGQQRLTSISKLFLSFDGKNEYYFDLLSILVEKFPNDKIREDSGIQEKCLTSKVSEIFCRSFAVSSDQSERPTRQSNRFISGKSIVDNKFGSVVSKFLRVFNDATEENIDKYTDHLNAILGAVGGYSIPATVIASDSELGVVIRVFEKVNSTGKKLTLFDLINAKSFEVSNAKFVGGLSSFLTNKLTDVSRNNREREACINVFFKYDEDKYRYEKLDRIVRVFEIADLLEKNASPSIFKSAMLMRSSEFWFDSWNKHGSEILEILSWVHKEGLNDIGQTTFLEYAIAILLANPKSFRVLKFKQELKKYALYLTLSGTSFSKTNLDIVEKLYGISKKMTDSYESVKMDYISPSNSPSLSYDQILEITPSNSKFRAIMNIFYTEKISGKFTVDMVGNSVKYISRESMDFHHIFPKSRVEGFSNKGIFNSVANFVLLDSSTNREIFKDKSPKEYFEVINRQSNSKFNCEQNLIDLQAWCGVESQIGVNDLLSSRAKDIADLINSYFDV